MVREKVTLPKPFPIPKFRSDTEDNFGEKKLTGTDRKYVVQTLATMLMTYVQKPSLDHCGKVAKALVDKYRFIKDGEGDGEVHVIYMGKLKSLCTCWEIYISTFIWNCLFLLSI